MSRRSLAITALFVVCFGDGTGLARTIGHVVRRGDNLEVLAAEYYGNRTAAVYIMAANNITHERPLRPGSRLKIPTAWRYRIRQGESLADIAQTQLGDRRRAPFLTLFSGLKQDPKAGTEIVIPFHLTHRADAPETLGMVAAALYGDSSRGELLRTYNFRTSARLERGERVIVPISNIQVRPSKMPQASVIVKEEQTARAESSARVDARLKGAAARFRSGEYAEVTADLVQLLAEEDPTEVEIAEVEMLLAFCYVALDQGELAVRAFREVLARKPDLTLAPEQVSPKIRLALDRARAQVAVIPSPDAGID